MNDLLLILPGIICLCAAIYYIFIFNSIDKKRNKKELMRVASAFLGPLVLFKKDLIDEESRPYLVRYHLFLVCFLIYFAFLILFFIG